MFLWLSISIVIVVLLGTISLNGRCGKAPDVCYSWWVGMTMFIIDSHFKTHLLCEASLFDKESQTMKEEGMSVQDRLVDWILSCQHCDTGGFSRSPLKESSRGLEGALKPFCVHCEFVTVCEFSRWKLQFVSSFRIRTVFKCSVCCYIDFPYWAMVAGVYENC